MVAGDVAAIRERLIASMRSDVPYPREFAASLRRAHSFHILMKGSIVAAAEGDLLAAKRAKQLAASLLERHR